MFRVKSAYILLTPEKLIQPHMVPTQPTYFTQPTYLPSLPTAGALRPAVCITVGDKVQGFIWVIISLSVFLLQFAYGMIYTV